MLTAVVLPCAVPETPQFATRALVVLKRNLQHLIADRKESQVALARHVRHSKSWINKFLNDTTDRTEIQIKDVDRIASFFGIEPYQLFQPGISRLTERRSGVERRANYERRVGHSGRLREDLRTELNKVPRLASHDHAALSASAQGLPVPVQRILSDAYRRIDAYLRTHPGEDVSSGQRAAASASRRRRKPARSDPKK